MVGDRQTDTIEHFSFLKKKFQKLGSWIVRRLSGTRVPDTVSGFRAFSREAAMQINVISSYSYTVETIIQAGNKRLAITSVSVRTNPKTRESRLVKSIPRFMMLQMSTMVRMYAMFRPLRTFFMIGAVLIGAAMVPSLRFFYFYLMGKGRRPHSIPDSGDYSFYYGVSGVDCGASWGCDFIQPQADRRGAGAGEKNGKRFF